MEYKLNVPFIKQNVLYNILLKYKVEKYNIINDDKNSNYINGNVDEIYVINLSDNIFRRKYIELLFKKYGINYILIVVERPTENIKRHFTKSLRYSNFSVSELGCLLSHLWCLHDAYINNYNNIIIFEDDIILHKEFHKLFECYMNYNISYDFLLLGASDFDFRYVNSVTLNNEKGLYSILPNSKNSFGAHAIYYSRNALIYILEQRLTNPVFYDREFCVIFDKFKDKSYVCYPNLVLTEFSTTNLNHNYSLSSQEDLYYNNCFINLNFSNYNFIYLGLFIKNKEYILNHKNKTYKEILDYILLEYKDTNKQDYSHRFVLDYFNVSEIIDILC